MCAKWIQPLPFLYISTGTETRFTSQIDPQPRSRLVFHFHRPGTLLRWATHAWPAATAAANKPLKIADFKASYFYAATLRGKLQSLPPVDPTGLWPAQLRAVTNLEQSLRENRPRALIQMATGNDFVACFHPDNRHERRETWLPDSPNGHWRWFTYDELMQRDKLSLDLFWVKDETLEDSASLPAPDEIAADIVEDLRAALEQFEAIQADLAAAPT